MSLHFRDDKVLTVQLVVHLQRALDVFRERLRHDARNVCNAGPPNIDDSKYRVAFDSGRLGPDLGGMKNTPRGFRLPPSLPPSGAAL